MDGENQCMLGIGIYLIKMICLGDYRVRMMVFNEGNVESLQTIKIPLW